MYFDITVPHGAIAINGISSSSRRRKLLSLRFGFESAIWERIWGGDGGIMYDIRDLFGDSMQYLIPRRRLKMSKDFYTLAIDITGGWALGCGGSCGVAVAVGCEMGCGVS